MQPRRGGVLAGTLQAKRAWMLDEHRTAKQRAVLPGTGYLELLRAAVREVGETGPFEIEDLFFFRAAGSGRRRRRWSSGCGCSRPTRATRPRCRRATA